MSLAESFSKAQHDDTHIVNPCAVYKIKQNMTEEDVKFFDSILYDKTIAPRLIIQTLRNANQPTISDQVVRRHRLRQCSTCR